MASYYGRDFDNIFKLLVKKLKCKFPIKLRTLNQIEIDKINKNILQCDESVYAICVTEHNIKNNKITKAIIYIVRKLPKLFAEHLLLHELAHLIQKGGDKSPHGYRWGEAYAKVYNIYIGKDIRKK